MIHPEIFCKSEQKIIQSVLNQVLEKINRKKIKALDLGTGTGNIVLKLLSKKEIDFIVGVDLSKEMLAKLQKKTEGNPKIKLVCNDVDSFLRNDKDQYDLITISSVLHHLPDYFITVKEILERLRGGGALIIFHEPTGKQSWILDIFAWLDSRIFVNLFLSSSTKKVVKSLKYTDADYHIYHGFQLAKLKKYFEDNGLRIIYYNRHNVFKLGIFRLLGKIVSSKNNFILAILKE